MPDSIAAVLYAYLIFVGATDFAMQDRYIDASAKLDKSMTPAEVLEVMGPPSGRYEATGFLHLAFLNFQPKHWYWGERVDIHRLVLPSLPVANWYRLRRKWLVPFQVQIDKNGKLHFGDYPSEKFIHKLADELKADEDELLLLADKVPAAIRRSIQRRPDLFRKLAALNRRQLDELEASLKTLD